MVGNEPAERGAEAAALIGDDRGVRDWYTERMAE
jgi:hypothetical protein